MKIKCKGFSAGEQLTYNDPNHYGGLFNLCDDKILTTGCKGEDLQMPQVEYIAVTPMFYTNDITTVEIPAKFDFGNITDISKGFDFDDESKVYEYTMYNIEYTVDNLNKIIGVLQSVCDFS